ncbi:MAG: translocation/assembly module TamB domain-containing protein [Caulobacteraceae bacterium]|nr:translocation/assembly module TamB domain-containing protein [Caulobacter sp.]
MGVAAFVLLVAGLLFVARFGAATDPGRAIITRLVEGLKLGPVGRLHIEGLSGDVFGRFGVRRLSIVDDRGAWLDARDLEMRWSPGELLRRRVHAERLRAGDLAILRRPDVEPRPRRAPSEAPVSIAVDDLSGRIETRPAFSSVPGDWDVSGRIDYSRAGRAAGRIDAASRLHAGDGVKLRFAIGRKEIHLAGDAVEGRGGALAGALGLPADHRFLVTARADGDDRGGAFHLDARSGDAQPAAADGRWTPEGGRLDARIQLSASRLTHYFAERIGPELHVQGRGARRPDGLYQLQATAVGAAARAVASGPVDVKRLRTPGLDLDVAIDRLTTWVKEVDAGPVQAHGVFTGDLAAFTYKGRLAGERLLRQGYVLARAEGPAELSRTRAGFYWKGQLQGAGGGGAGPLVPIIGPRPAVQAQGELPKDKRILIDELHLQGANIRVDASGGRGLLGDYLFKGNAHLLSVAGVHPGSRGAVDATWSARAGKGDKAWRFDFDARGQAFASGLPEVDRLLGPAPRVTGDGVYLDEVFSIARADLAGAKLTAQAQGRYGRADALDFGLTWRAAGPFAAGPVEVAGLAQGSGRLGGTLKAPTADLQAELASLDLGRLLVAPAHLHLTFARGGDALAGEAALNGPTRDGPAQARTRFRFVPGGLELSDLLADAGGVRLAGSLALRDGAPSSADLQLAAGPGVFLGSGRLAGAVKIAASPDGAPTADLRLQGADLSAPGQAVRLKRLQLAASGPLDRLPLRLSAAVDAPAEASFSGTGLLAKAAAGHELTLSGAGKAKGADYRTLQPARLAFGPGGRAVSLRLAVADGRLSLDGRQAADGALHAQAQVQAISLGAVLDDYAGALDATLQLDGEGSALSGRMDARLTGARTRDAEANLALDATLHAQLAGQQLRLQAQASNRQGLRAATAVDLPATAAADPFRIAIDRTRPLKGDFSVDGELKPLWDLFAGGERTLSGRMVARGTLGGTLAAPKPTGTIAIADGRFVDLPTGLTLDKLQADAALASDHVTVNRFSGTDGQKGTLSGQGVVGLAANGASSFQLALSRFQLIDNDLGKATASGSVAVSRDAAGKAKVAGKLRIDRADITTKTPIPTGVVPLDVTEVNLPLRPGGAPARPPRPAGSGLVALDVTLSAPSGVLVRGRGLDAELSLDAHVGGTTAAPQLTGVARIVRGSYDFGGKRFDIDPTGVIRLASKPEDIRLDLKAERNDPALDAVIRITGTAARPQISLSSQPVLPPDEILSRVLFGVSASQLSGFEAAQMATALASLSGGGGFDILANLRQFAGLDRLALGGGDSSGASITGGKYITNDVYVELTGAAQGRSQTATTAAQIARTGPSASVEWRVRRDLSLISQAWTGGDARLSVRFRRSW